MISFSNHLLNKTQVRSGKPLLFSGKNEGIPSNAIDELRRNINQVGANMSDIEKAQTLNQFLSAGRTSQVGIMPCVNAFNQFLGKEGNSDELVRTLAQDIYQKTKIELPLSSTEPTVRQFKKNVDIFIDHLKGKPDADMEFLKALQNDIMRTYVTTIVKHAKNNASDQSFS